MLARALMTRDVLSLRPTDTLEEAILKMAERGISGAPVVDEAGRLVGILSESDILSRLKELAEKEISGRYLTTTGHALSLLSFLAERGHPMVSALLEHVRSSRVAEAMKRKVITAIPADTVEEVVALMIRHDINRVPIVERGKVVGIITRADLLRVLTADSAGFDGT